MGTLQISYTSFISCKSSTLGGGVNSMPTSSSISFCCGYGCICNGPGQFLRICLSASSSSDSNDNTVNFTSALLCAPTQVSNSYESMILGSGNCFFNNCNASFNKVQALRSAFAPDTLYYGGLRLCTASSNVGTSCIRLYESTQICDSCNIFNNTGHESGAGELFELKGSSTLENCAIIGSGETLFAGGGSANVYNCVFSNSAVSDSSVSLSGCTFGIVSYKTKALSEFHTHMCDDSFTFGFTAISMMKYLGAKVLPMVVFLITE